MLCVFLLHRASGLASGLASWCFLFLGGNSFFLSCAFLVGRLFFFVSSRSSRSLISFRLEIRLLREGPSVGFSQGCIPNGNLAQTGRTQNDPTGLGKRVAFARSSVDLNSRPCGRLLLQATNHPFQDTFSVQTNETSTPQRVGHLSFARLTTRLHSPLSLQTH